MSVMVASIWVKFISKNSNTHEIEHNSPIIIPRYRFHFRSTDLTDKPHFIGFRVNLLINHKLLHIRTTYGFSYE